MNSPMATRGTFADFRIVKTRKLAQLVIEIPIEEADAALTALGGLPRSDMERWVAVARLDVGSNNEHTHIERRAFCDLPFTQQAGIKSNDAAFQEWAVNNHRLLVPSSGTLEFRVASAIRDYCEVSSRSHIMRGTLAGERWLTLLREFEGAR